MCWRLHSSWRQPCHCRYAVRCLLHATLLLHASLPLCRQRDPLRLLVTASLLQDMPYALLGTCLGAIVAYELAQCAGLAGLPLPVALFTAAVSPPHLYAEAVAQLYAAPGSAAAGPDMMAGVLQKLQDWQSLPKELIMQVRRLSPACRAGTTPATPPVTACCRQVPCRQGIWALRPCTGCRCLRRATLPVWGP